MTVIIDYGVGNLFSLVSSFEKIGEKAVVSKDIAVIRNAERIILPGVGAFKDAAEKLFSSGLVPILKEKIENGTPLMGICLGMQLLFEKSHEYGVYEGLGLIKGEIRPINEVSAGLKIPHMGWNALKFNGKKHPLFKYINEGDHVYFVHSYYGKCTDKNDVTSFSEYGGEVTASVAKGNVMGCQFHPEKSGNTGLAILRSFCEMREGKIC